MARKNDISELTNAARDAAEKVQTVAAEYRDILRNDMAQSYDRDSVGYRLLESRTAAAGAGRRAARFASRLAATAAAAAGDQLAQEGMAAALECLAAAFDALNTANACTSRNGYDTPNRRAAAIATSDAHVNAISD